MYFVLSDIHGSITYLDKALAKFEVSKCEKIILCGDVLYHGPRNPLIDRYDPKDCVDLLNKYKDKIQSCRGNCDSEVDQMVLQFPIMSDNLLLPLGEKKVLVSHGHLYETHRLPFIGDGDIYLSGHTHIPRADVEYGIYCLNPGSITFPKGGSTNSYGILTESKFTVYDLEDNILLERTLK